MNLFTRLLAFGSLAICVFGVAEISQAAELKAGALALRLDETGGVKIRDTIANAETKEAVPLLVLFDGRKKDEEIKLPKPEKVEPTKEGVRIIYRGIAASLDVTQSFSVDHGVVRIRVEVANRGTEPAWLKVRLNLPVALGKEGLACWNGNSVKPNVATDLKREELFNTFPMACAYNQTSGLAVGIAARQIFCHIENGLLLSQDPPRLYFGVKLVVDAQKSNQAEFVAYAFAPEYGYLNAVAAYQETAPEMFQPTPGLDPRIHTTAKASNNFYYEALAGRPGGSPEYSRRQCEGWSWGYAPFQVPGDWYGTREIVENPDLHSMKQVEYGTFDAFQKNRPKAITASKARNIAFLFYITNWCDQKMGEKFYPGCMVTDKNTSNLVGPTWILQGDMDYRMWMWGNKFSEDAQRDIKRIVADLPVSGFAFDCASDPGICRQQPGVEQMEGRAYDAEGVYAIAGAGNARILDFIHQQKRDGRPMGISCNLAGNKVLYFVAMRTDNGLTDWSFSESVNNVNAEEVLRFLLGTRSHNWCTLIDKENYGSSLPWQEFTPEKIREVYNNIRDNIILFCFRFAYFPNDAFSWGNVKIMKTMPVYERVFRAGYQVIPAFKLSENLWRARYGRDLNAYLFIGNQKFNAQEIAATVDHRYLGEGAYLFCRYDGAPLANAVEKDVTTIKYSLKPKEPLILKAVLNIRGGGALKMDGEILETIDAAGGRTVAKLNCASEGKARLRLRAPEDMACRELKVNGKVVMFTGEEGCAMVETKLAKTNTLEAQWQSTVFRSAEKELLDYPFVAEDGKPACAIVMADTPDENDANTAFRLQEYFRYYFDKAKKTPDVKIPIRKRSEVAELQNAVLIGVEPSGPEGIRLLEKGNLHINGPDSVRRFALANQLMRLLDKKYVYYGVIGGDVLDGNTYTRDPATREMREKGGLGIGKVWEE